VAAGRFALRLDESSGDELAEVAAGFNQMVRRLRELDELKRDFLSHISHELNTPLVAMRETNELLLDGLAGPLTAEQRRMLELNRDASVRLSSMIGKILDLSRLEAGAMEYDFAPHELGELLRRTTAELAAVAQERGIDLALELPECEVRVHCDHDRLWQVIHNLTANALKFAPAGSRVEVSLAPPPPDGSAGSFRPGRDSKRAVVRVSDEGPGVAVEERERIFDKFHRGSRNGSHGFGLGLAISREIVTAHGGRIWVEPRAPQGSVFAVELAAARGGERAAAAARAPLGAGVPATNGGLP
jgi:two-component system sensor histidine kinase GlrK